MIGNMLKRNNGAAVAPSRSPAPQPPQAVRPPDAAQANSNDDTQPGDIAGMDDPALALESRPKGPERSEQADLLSEHFFIDLYLTTGEITERPVIKGLIRSTDKRYGNAPGITKVPMYLMPDVTIFGEQIASHFEETKSREFALTYDGVSYRVSLIGKPENKVGRPEDNPESRDWCIRQISASVPNIKDLSFPASIARALVDMRKDRGLCIIAGSFASGKSTTAAVTFDNWVSLEKDVGITLEDPVEFPMARVTDDRGVIYQIDLTERPLEQAIRHSKRWSPRFMMLGEVRTAEAATEMLQMAISGPMLICTIHANDLISSVMSLVKFASAQMSEQAARELVAASIHTVVHQEFKQGRLVQTMMRVAGDENFGLRKKIEMGMFQHMRDDIGRQQINRTKS